MRVARVLVDSPLPQLDRLLDYRIPDELDGADAVVPGVRVSVPLRSARRLATAWVVEVADAPQFPGPISDVAALVSPVAVLRPEVWRLARAVADRAAGSANDVLRLAIPPRQARVESTWHSGPAPEAPPLTEARSATGYAAEPLRTVADGSGRVALQARRGVTQVTATAWVPRWALTLVELASAPLARRESAIVIVPDHRDQEHILTAASALLPAESVIRWDARQTRPDRYRGLLRASTQPALIIGTRSAVYAPAARLGLIAMWNDGDPVLTEPLAPYVHPRDAALIRAEQQGASLVFAGHTRTAEVERLVEMGWLTAVTPQGEPHPRVVVTESMTADETLARMARIPSFAWQTARQALGDGPVLVQVSRPGGDGAGADRTAHDLGRAFPGVRVVVADGERPLFRVDERPQLVIAPRGAEPLAAGGYRAVLLLDGDRMLMRESLRVTEDCLRWWADAAALAADGATIVLTGVSGRLAQLLATWRLPEHAAHELADRRALRFPPALRVATLEGFPDALDAALVALRDPETPVELAIPTRPDPADASRARAVIRFDYAHGAAVAQRVRAEIVRQAARRRKPVAGRPAATRAPLPLRARFDDGAPFDEARGPWQGRIEG